MWGFSRLQEVPVGHLSLGVDVDLLEAWQLEGRLHHLQEPGDASLCWHRDRAFDLLVFVSHQIDSVSCLRCARSISTNCVRRLLTIAEMVMPRRLAALEASFFSCVVTRICNRSSFSCVMSDPSRTSGCRGNLATL